MRSESSPAGIRRTDVPDRQAGLRRDISELSAVLGRTLVRQEGADLLDLFERVRHLLGTDREAAADFLTALAERLRASRRAGHEPDPGLSRALLLTANGIAAGMRNTG